MAERFTLTEKIDLGMLANDIAELLSREEYGIDVDSDDVMRGLVPFIDMIAPGHLPPEQRFGIGG